MRRYYTEDRSNSETSAPDTARSNLTLQDMEHLTDFTAEEFDSIASMNVGDELIIGNWIYIKRTHD